jgi:hypothetical protein
LINSTLKGKILRELIRNLGGGKVKGILVIYGSLRREGITGEMSGLQASQGLLRTSGGE